MKPLIERVATYVYKHRIASSAEIAKALGETTHRISGVLKHERVFARWGLEKHEPYKMEYHHKGRPSNVWTIDPAKYEYFLANRRSKQKGRPPPPPKAVPPRKKPAPKLQAGATTRQLPPYNGPHRTVWQPTSPYFRGERNEHASPSQGSPAVQ